MQKIRIPFYAPDAAAFYSSGGRLAEVRDGQLVIYPYHLARVGDAKKAIEIAATALGASASAAKRLALKYSASVGGSVAESRRRWWLLWLA